MRTANDNMRFSEAPEPSSTTDGEPTSSGEWTQQPRTNPTPNRKPQTSHRVLIVDDEPEVLRVLAQTMRHDGFEVSCAESLEQGVATLHASEFDLVLTDLYLGPNDLGSKIAESAQSLRPCLLYTSPSPRDTA